MRRALWCVLACVAAGRSPAPFNATRWFGGECGTKRAGVTVVETRFMQGQGRFEALVGARLEQLLAVALPSMARQTTQCFVWVLLTDPALPEGPRARLEKALAPHAHMRLVDSVSQTDREKPNTALFEATFGEGEWRGAMRDAKEFTLIRLDADDALKVQYVETVVDWRRRNGTTKPLGPGRTYAYLCSSQSLGWTSAHARGWERGDAGKAPVDAHLNVISESLAQGCLASGLTMAHHVSGGVIAACAPKPCSANHDKLRRRFAVSVLQGPPPVFRVRSVTSNGGSAHEGGRVVVKPKTVERDFGIPVTNLLALTRYLSVHEADVAREMLDDQAARGCNGHYSGSCDRGSAVDWAREVVHLHTLEARAGRSSGAAVLKSTRCYARRYPDVVDALCAGEEKFCDGMVLWKYHVDEGRAEGRRWGCGKF